MRWKVLLDNISNISTISFNEYRQSYPNEAARAVKIMHCDEHTSVHVVEPHSSCTLTLYYRANRQPIEKIIIIAQSQSVVRIHEIESGNAQTNIIRSIVIFAHQNASIDWDYEQRGEINEVTCNYTMVLARNSVITMNHVVVHGSVNFFSIDLLLQEENAQAFIKACGIADESQNIVYKTKQIHSAPHTQSVVDIRGILAHKSRSDFDGLISIGKGAIHSNAEQYHKTILLSNLAQSQAKPQLEIHADAVKCKHGSACGQLDKEHLFYLHSRGLSLYYAKKLLLQGFMGDSICVDLIEKKLRTIL